MITESTVSSDEITIDAPIELVWSVLVDFANYGAWNEFCPSCEAQLELGSPVRMQVDLGMGLQEQVEYLCQLEPPHTIAWGMENKPDDPIHAVRTQYLKALDDNRCSYISVDEFGGPAMAPMIETMGAAVEEGFNRCGYGLKKYCEALHGGKAS